MPELPSEESNPPTNPKSGAVHEIFSKLETLADAYFLDYLKNLDPAALTVAFKAKNHKGLTILERALEVPTEPNALFQKYSYLLNYAPDAAFTRAQMQKIFYALRGREGWLGETINQLSRENPPYHGVILNLENQEFDGDVCELMAESLWASEKFAIKNETQARFVLMIMRFACAFDYGDLFNRALTTLIDTREHWGMPEENLRLMIAQIVKFGHDRAAASDPRSAETFRSRYNRAARYLTKFMAKDDNYAEMLRKALDNFALAEQGADLHDPLYHPILTLLLKTHRYNRLHQLIGDDHGLANKIIQQAEMPFDTHFMLLAKAYALFGMDKELTETLAQIVKLKTLEEKWISSLIDIIVPYKINDTESIPKFIKTLASLLDVIKTRRPLYANQAEYFESALVKKLLELSAPKLTGESIRLIRQNPGWIPDKAEPDYVAWLGFGILQDYANHIDTNEESDRGKHRRQIESWCAAMIKEEQVGPKKSRKTVSHCQALPILLNNVDKLNVPAKEILFEFIANNFGTIIESGINLNEFIGSMSKHAEDLKIPYKQIIGYKPKGQNTGMRALALIQTLGQKNLLVDKTDRVVALDNPIFLAARSHDQELIDYAFAHRAEVPWQNYWQQAGDEDNELLRYLLQRPPDLVTDILAFACDLPGVVKYVNRPFLTETRNVAKKLKLSDIYEHNIAILKGKIYRANSWSKVWRRKGVVNIWEEFLRVQVASKKAKKSILILSKEDKDAHREDIEEYAYKLANENYAKLLEEAYPDVLAADREKAIAIDARLLLIKQYIEHEPSKNPKDRTAHKMWESIIQCCNAGDYYTESKSRNISFQEFKKFALRPENKVIIDTATFDDLQGVTELSKLLRSYTVDPDVYYSWQGFKPGRNAINYSGYHVDQAYQASDKLKFVYFNVLLITEDVDALVEQQKDAAGLLAILKGNDATDQQELKSVRRELSWKSANIAELKPRVKNLLLDHQRSMAGKLQLSFVASKGICNTGVVTTFATTIMAGNYRFFELSDRSVQIQEYMNNEFGKLSERFIIELLLKRLQQKVAAPFAQNKGRGLGFFIGRYGKRAKVEESNAQISNALLKEPPRYFSALIDRIKGLDMQAQRFIITSFFNMDEKKELRDPFNLAEDAELKKLFDTLFSLNQDNFLELFTGAGAVPAYSGLVSQQRNHTGEQPQDAVIALDEFDSKYGRTGLLSKGFGIPTLFSNIYADLREKESTAPPLSRAERAAARFFCLTGPEEKVANNIAANNLASLKSLMLLGPIDDFIYKLNAVIKTRASGQYNERVAITSLRDVLEPKIAEFIKDQDIKDKDKIDTLLVAKEICKILLQENQQLNLLTYDVPGLLKITINKIPDADIEVVQSLDKLREIFAKQDQGTKHLKI